MKQNLAAWTSLEASYPEYVSINQAAPSSGVEITVRGPKKPDGNCGDTVSALLSREEFSKLLTEANKAFEPTY